MAANLASATMDKIHSWLKKHEADRATMVAMMKKIYASYNALKDTHTKTVIELTQTKKDLDRAQSENKRLEKQNNELSNDVVMLSSTVSLLDQSVTQGDDILIDSIRSVVRDFKLEDGSLSAITSMPTLDIDAVSYAAPAARLIALKALEAVALPEIVAESDDLPNSGVDEGGLPFDDIETIEKILATEMSIEIGVAA